MERQPVQSEGSILEAIHFPGPKHICSGAFLIGSTIRVRFCGILRMKVNFRLRSISDYETFGRHLGFWRYQFSERGSRCGKWNIAAEIGRPILIIPPNLHPECLKMPCLKWHVLCHVCITHSVCQFNPCRFEDRLSRHGIPIIKIRRS